MQLTTLATLSALVVAHVAASPDVATPSGIPATSGLPFGTLTFETTAEPSLFSALSSLISSQSTAVMPFTTTHSDLGPASSASVGTATGGTSTPTSTTASVSVVSASVVPTSTSGARRLRDGGSGMVAGVVLGAVAALIC
ncbi:hypothetical protein HD554DRAFT_1316413 [Boletus coccyginus]|nr:hypothetical protein HD554DRAFT_1316413 [Boletus coccyginus]